MCMSTFATPKWNNCNIRQRQLKHLQHMSETLAKQLKNTWKSLQTYATSRWNTCNRRIKHLKHLKHTLATCMYIQHPDLLLQHSDENTWKICLIQVKHLKYTLEACVYSHCDMCNIPIYFCNIPIYFCNINIKHLQHTSETLEIYVCNMFFQCKHLLAASVNGG
jgi:hypothetical protein